MPENCVEITVGVTLHRDDMVSTDLHQNGYVRYILTAIDAVGMPAEIFLYEQRPRDAFKGIIGERFLGICSKPDLNEYPVAEPDIELDYPYYRKAVCDLEFRSPIVAERAYDRIVRRVEQLIVSIRAGECLESAGDVRIGDLLEEGT